MYEPIESIKIVKMIPSASHLQGLYLNDKLYLSGNEHIDSIEALISGFILGLKYFGCSGNVEFYTYQRETTYNEFPIKFDDLDLGRLNNAN